MSWIDFVILVVAMVVFYAWGFRNGHFWGWRKGHTEGFMDGLGSSLEAVGISKETVDELKQTIYSKIGDRRKQ